LLNAAEKVNPLYPGLWMRIKSAFSFKSHCGGKNAAEIAQFEGISNPFRCVFSAIDQDFVI